MKLVWTPLSEAIEHERNPKDHDEELIRASINRFGFNDPIAVNEATGKLLEGHGRLTVLKSMFERGDEPPPRVKVTKGGEWSVPLIRGLSFEDEKEAQAYMVAHNRTSESGGWVDTLLGQMLKDFDQDDKELWDAIGFDVDDAFRFIASGEAKDTGYGEEIGAGMLPEAKEEAFLDGDIKQVVIYLVAEDYAPTLNRLASVMEKEKLVSHTAALLRLLDLYEAR